MKELTAFKPDGLHLPKIKPHSLEKLQLHNYYAEIFTGGMKDGWPNLVYLGLYSGAGAAEVETTGEIVETSALSVLNQAVPFTKYILVDEDPDCADALRKRAASVGKRDRVTTLQENVNQCVPAVLKELPDWNAEGGVLTFCFIDPFKIDLDFEVIRRLSHLRIDILLMIPLGYDVRRNWRDYLDRLGMRQRLNAFLGESEWAEEWEDLGLSHAHFPRFIQGRMNRAMERLGFIEQESRDIKDVKVAGKNVYLYSLHLYSKHPLAQKLWREALKGTSEQRSLGL